MALRKEEFHYHPYEKRHMGKSKSAKRLLTIEVSAELEERITGAANQQKLSVNQYLEGVLSEVVPAQIAMKRTRKPVSREGVEKLMQVRDQILQEHGGQPFENSTELLRQEREERDKELGF